MKASLTRFAYIIVFLVAVGYAFFAFPQGMHSWQEKQRQIQEMEKRNDGLAKQVERQKEYINRLKNSPAAQELEIRKRLKLLHPEEQLYIMGDPDSPGTDSCGEVRRSGTRASRADQGVRPTEFCTLQLFI